MARQTRKDSVIPDATTPAGQLAYWLRVNMPEDITAADLGAAVGRKAIDTGYNWVNGTNAPPMDVWAKLAVFLGLGNQWEDLLPPPEFLADLRQRGHVDDWHRPD